MKLKPICALPEGHPAYRNYQIVLKPRGGGRYAITRGEECLNEDGGWDYEPPPSERLGDHKWLNAHRFDIHTARKLAKLAAPKVVVNGRSAADVLAGRNAAKGGSAGFDPKSNDWFGNGDKYDEDPKQVRKHGHQALLRTRDGRWNLNSWPEVGRDDGSEDGTYEYIDDETAKAWLLRNGHHAAIEKWFGATA